MGQNRIGHFLRAEDAGKQTSAERLAKQLKRRILEARKLLGAAKGRVERREFTNAQEVARWLDGIDCILDYDDVRKRRGHS